MNIYVQTHDKGIHLIEAYQVLFNRHWGRQQPVIILGYGQGDFELAPNFRFVSLGEDKGPKIGGALIDFFSGVEDRHFIYTVYSQLIIEPVDLRLLGFLAHIIEGSDRVGRIALTGDLEVNQPYSCTSLQCYNGFSMVEYLQAANHRVSAIWSMWSKGYFLKYLQRDMDLWAWETEGSRQAKNDGWQILTTTGRYPITCCRVYKRGRLHAGSFRGWDQYGDEMSQEDQAIVRPLMCGPTWAAAGEGVNC